MDITLICVASLALLQISLAMMVSLQRIRGRVSQGMPDDPEHPLCLAVVAHRNACEYVPLMCLLLILLQLKGSPLWATWLGPICVLVRVAHAVSIIHFGLRRPSLLRRLGAGGTYLATLTMIGLLLAAVAG